MLTKLIAADPPPSERNTGMKKLLPEIKAGHTSGHPFCAAHVFAPEGTLFVTGSLDKIEEHLKDKPTCHGVFAFYSAAWAVTAEGKAARGENNVRLFGRDLQCVRPYHSTLSLVRISRSDVDTYPFIFRELIARRLVDERLRYYLIEQTYINAPEESQCKTQIKQHVLGSWRSMPSCYLRELAAFEKRKKQEISR